MNYRITALVETPSLPMPHSYSSTSLAATFGRYNSVNRPRRSDSYDQMAQSLPAALALESLAAELTRQLSTSPTGVFYYPSGEFRSGYDRRNIFQKSRSFPAVKRPEPTVKRPNPWLQPKRRSKAVRFADSQGLPLVEAVHQLSSTDSSYTENKIVPYPYTYTDDQVPLKKRVSKRTLSRRFDFTQPGSEPGFFDRISREHIVLESVRVESRALHGVVRVSNLAYDKEICIRWTHDNWKTSCDTSAVFCVNDGNTDRFSFELPISGDDVQFALRYRTNGQEFWDNNRGRNYCVNSLL